MSQQLADVCHQTLATRRELADTVARSRAMRATWDIEVAQGSRLPAAEERQSVPETYYKPEWIKVPRASHEAHCDRLDALQRAVRSLASQGDGSIQGDAGSLACRAGSVDAMLDTLIAWFEAQARGEAPPAD